ncbi:MAG: RimK family alpha-L-glutamate ligase [Candidatus Hermodarchaeota archaeon]
MGKVKIGIIIDRYHLEKKVSEFLKYLKSVADISLYIEETYCFKSSNMIFDEDLFFVKGKGDVILALVKQIEQETKIPVINPFKGIWNAIHRFMNSVLLRKVGIPVPDFSLNPSDCSPPFKSYIIKNIIDQKNYKFKPNIDKRNGMMKVSDERALNEIYDGFYGDMENIQFLYYQKFIESEWEYKVYIIGEKIYYYKQIPVLINPNKMESRRKIDEIPELKDLAFKAIETIGLKITSIDFLQDKNGQFFLTDINSTPNFNYIKNGPKMVGDYLIEQAKNG